MPDLTHLVIVFIIPIHPYEVVKKVYLRSFDGSFGGENCVVASRSSYLVLVRTYHG